MHGPFLHAAWLSFGVALLLVPLGMGLALRSGRGAAANRDPAVRFMAGGAIVLFLLYAAAGGLVATSGVAWIALLKALLIGTGAFAVAGIVLGLMRAMRNAGAAGGRR